MFRDKRGVEYDAVPLPTHEVTVAVALDARIVRRTAARKTVPVYAGTDGAELAEQPRGHRRHWTDRQWLAFEEHRRLEAELSRDDEPIATVWVVKPHDPASTDPPDPRREGHPRVYRLCHSRMTTMSS